MTERNNILPYTMCFFTLLEGHADENKGVIHNAFSDIFIILS
jgi:hypothetical protein